MIRCEASLVIKDVRFHCVREDGHVTGGLAQTQSHRAVAVTGKSSYWPHGTAHQRLVDAYVEWVDPKHCPDTGFCHHECVGGCFRVAECGPLSTAHYKNDKWPRIVKDKMGEPKDYRL